MTILYIYLLILSSCRGSRQLMFLQQVGIKLGLLDVKLKPCLFLEPTSVTEETTRNEGAPIPPPKDHVKRTETTTPTTNPVLDQFKRNTALLTKFLLQKKKDFTERKSSDANQQETGSPELHSETGMCV